MFARAPPLKHWTDTYASCLKGHMGLCCGVHSHKLGSWDLGQNCGACEKKLKLPLDVQELYSSGKSE
jgi:hypothetical protein